MEFKAGDLRGRKIDKKVLKALQILELSVKYQMNELTELIVKNFTPFIKSLADAGAAEDAILERETIYTVLLTARKLKLDEFEKVILGLIPG